MREKVFFKKSNGHKICAILSTPEDKSDVPVILICHGLNSGKDGMTNIALEEIFLQHNIASLRIDFFAHGESEGKIDDRSVAEFVDDIHKSIEYLKDRGYSRIGVYGASFGGVASVIAASKNSDIKVMALKAAGMGQTSRKMHNYKNDFDEKTWIKAGAKIHIPTLIVHGSADEDVEFAFAEELSKSIKDSHIEIFNNADHRFTKKEDFDRMVKILSEFLIRHIQK